MSGVAESFQPGTMHQMHHALGNAADPFAEFAEIRRINRPLFNEAAVAFLESASDNTEAWRYLALHFIREERYDLAARAADVHMALAPESREAFLRRYRIALLAMDCATAQRMLASINDRVGHLQFECSRFHYGRRFCGDVASTGAAVTRLQEVVAFELARALNEDLSLATARPSLGPAGPAFSQSGPTCETVDNAQKFAISLRNLLSAKRIILIGNGGSLTGSRLGHYIDAHDFVIRINFPTLTDSFDDAGKRTDLVLFTEAYLKTPENIEALYRLQADYLNVDGIAIDAARRDRSAKLLDFDDAGGRISLAPVGIRMIVRSLAYEFATTGLCSLILTALILRKEVEVLGFDFYAAHAANHFFDKISADAFLGHETAFEKMLVTRIFQNYQTGRQFKCVHAAS